MKEMRLNVVVLTLIVVFIAGFVVQEIAGMLFRARVVPHDIADAAMLISEIPFWHPYRGVLLVRNPELYVRLCQEQSVIVRTATWMLIPGPVVEVCIIEGENGVLEAGRIYQATLSQ